MTDKELSEKLHNAIFRLTTGDANLRTLQFDACLIALHNKEDELDKARELLADYGLLEPVEVSYDAPF